MKRVHQPKCNRWTCCASPPYRVRMVQHNTEPLNLNAMQSLLQQHKKRMKLNLAACAGCSLCAESCFLFELHDHDPRYMPSYKVLNSLGVLYRKRGCVKAEQLHEMAGLVWRNCVLCGRCYCPFGIDIPHMIALARDILRSQGIAGLYPHSIGEPEEEIAKNERAEKYNL